MMVVRTLLLAIVLVVALSGCRRDDPSPQPAPPAGYGVLEGIGNINEKIYSRTGAPMGTVEAFENQHQFPNGVAPGLLVRTPDGAAHWMSYKVARVLFFVKK